NRLFPIAQGSGGRRSRGAARQVAESLVVAAPEELPSPGQRSMREKKLRTPIRVVASRPPVVARREPRPPTRQIAPCQESDCPPISATRPRSADNRPLDTSLRGIAGASARCVPLTARDAGSPRIVHFHFRSDNPACRRSETY